MIVALLADVHANLPALEAVLADARAAGAGAVWYLGDFVGYGPFPEEVVRHLREASAASIIGNYDLKVLAFPHKKGQWRRMKSRQKYLAFRWACESLSADSRAYLASLPEQLRLTAGGLRVLLTHGSPAANDEALRADTPEQRLRELAAGAEADLVCCGHSHASFDREAGGVRFVNPGSVGRPEGSDPRAAYALLAFERGRLTVRQRRLAYDVQRTVDRLRALGLPDDFSEMLLRGRNLDEVRQARTTGRLPPATKARRPEDAAAIEAAIALAQSCAYEEEHTHQVTRIALALFEELRGLHGLGEDDRLLLQCGALLHDVGWRDGRKAHHKTAQRIILEADSLPLTPRRRQLVAMVARYHRKATPSEAHKDFAALSPADQRRVRRLAGILRVADGLDRSHTSLVRAVRCEVTPDRVILHCTVAGPAGPEKAAAAKKADVLEAAFERRLAIRIMKAS